MKLPLATLVAFAVIAVPAAADQGRALLATGYRVPVGTPDAMGAQHAVALPDGGAVLFSWAGPGRGIVGVRMRPDGTRDPSFRARIEPRGRTLTPTGALRRPDGRIVVTGSLLAGRPSQRDELVVAQLTPDGALDPSFGLVRSGLAGFTGAALAPDGSLVVAGEDAERRLAIARIGATGRVERTSVVPGSGRDDFPRGGVRVTPDGRMTVLFGARVVAARLLPDGSADPTFNGGAPARVGVHATDFVVGDDGSVTALGETRVARLTADGARDTAFGKVPVGDASLGRLLAEPGGGVLVYRTPALRPRPGGVSDLVLTRVSATGARTSVLLRTGLGGGLGDLARTRTSPLRQSGFAVGEIVVRPDGSYLATGGVSLIQYAGEGEGTSSARNAVIALTPELRIDRSFGPAFKPASFGVKPLGRRRLTFRLRVRASGPGLLAVRVRDRRGRLLAAGLAPVHRAGRSTVRVRATRRHGRPVGYVARFRDLGGATSGVAAAP
jgi:uncharacterized delta-60 repeat protein